MHGIISNFRGSRKSKRGNYMLITVPGVTSREKAQALVGKSVVWTTPGKEKKTITGKVTGSHGNKGGIKALFERGMPGQSLGNDVSIE